MKKRFVKTIKDQDFSVNTSINEVLHFEDFSNLKCVSYVGQAEGVYLEIRTHDGRETLVDSVPIAYLKMGSGREELQLNSTITNNAVRLVISLDGGYANGALVFTCEK